MDAYVPAYSEGDKTWYPSNEAARALVQLVHAWRDIAKLNEIRLVARKNDDIADKLLLKHILVEFFSALDHAKKLQGIIRKAPKLIAGQPAPYRYVTKKDIEVSTAAYKALWQELAPKEQLIARIRNNIGAHRSAEIGIELDELWSELDAENFVGVLNRVPAIIEAVDDLNIYDWSWADGESGLARLFGSRIIHDWEDAFDENEVEPQR